MEKRESEEKSEREEESRGEEKRGKRDGEVGRGEMWEGGGGGGRREERRGGEGRGGDSWIPSSGSKFTSFKTSSLTNEGGANDDHILSLGCLSDLVGLVRLTQEEDIVQVKPSNGQAARSVRV